MTARVITNFIQQKYPDVLLTVKDTENLMRKARDEALGGYTPTQALIKLFDDQGVKHFFRKLNGHVSAILWSYPWCQSQWRLHPHLISMDNPYKTNRLKVPLVNVTGVTNITTTFNIAFGVVNLEDEEAFT